MSSWIYSVGLQWKLDIRNKGILITYYLMPLLFFGVMGGIFTTIDPLANETIIYSMSVFVITMGSVLGAPIPVVEFFRSEVKRSYIVGNIPLWSVVVNNFISGMIHLLITSSIIYIVAPIAFNASMPENMLIHLLKMLIVITTSLSVGTVLGLLVSNTSKLTMVSQIIFLPSMLLSGIMFPLELLPEGLQYAGKVLPATWGYIMLAQPTLEWSALMPLAIICVLCIAISIWKLGKLRRI